MRFICITLFPRLRTPLLALGLFVFLLAGCGDEGNAPANQDAGSSKTGVLTFTTCERLFPDLAEGVGQLETPVSAPVSPELAATVLDAHFTEGQQVARGDLLFTLDDAKIRHDIGQAEAELEAARNRLSHARATHERFQSLYESRTISEQEYERRWSEFKTAAGEVRRLRSRLALQRERLEDTRIAAPVPGAISQRYADPGDLVSPEDVLATIYDLTTLEAVFQVNERAQGRIRRGQAVAIETEAHPDAPLEGTVDFVAPSLDPQTRKLTVKASIPNQNVQLRPGAFITAVVTLDSGEKRPCIPEQALVPGLAGYSVFVVEDGVARRREVTLGRRIPGMVEILSGVTPGEEVVAAGMQKLRDGDEVAIAGQAEVGGADAPATALNPSDGQGS